MTLTYGPLSPQEVQRRFEEALREEAEKKAYDPDQPRDDHGRWTETGGVAIGITPNVQMVGSFGGAAAKWNTPVFESLAADFEKDMEAEMPGRVSMHRQIGMWEGEWEPSYEVRVKGASADETYAAAEKIQHKYGQEGIASFDYGDGDDAVVSLTGFTDPDQMGGVLVESGLPGSSFSMDGKKAGVIVTNDEDGAKALQKVLDYASAHDLDVSFESGKARF